MTTRTARTVGWPVAGVAAAALMVAGAGTANAMGPVDPPGAYFVSDGNSISAHIDQSLGITDCQVVAQGPTSSDFHESDWTSDEWITVWVPPNRYTATVMCRFDGTGPNGWIIRQEHVNAPPLLHESAIDFIERTAG